jgi:hypothetical protein
MTDRNQEYCSIRSVSQRSAEPVAGFLTCGNSNEVELRRFELLTSCIPSGGSTSTHVHPRTSPSLPVPASPPDPHALRYFPAVLTHPPITSGGIADSNVIVYGVQISAHGRLNGRSLDISMWAFMTGSSERSIRPPKANAWAAWLALQVVVRAEHPAATAGLAG